MARLGGRPGDAYCMRRLQKAARGLLGGPHRAHRRCQIVFRVCATPAGCPLATLYVDARAVEPQSLVHPNRWIEPWHGDLDSVDSIDSITFLFASLPCRTPREGRTCDARAPLPHGRGVGLSPCVLPTVHRTSYLTLHHRACSRASHKNQGWSV